jgi:hypothetical protein
MPESLNNSPAKGVVLSNGLYDKLRNLVQLGLPAFAAFYFTLASVWGLPNSEAVGATAAALATLLGILLRISMSSYAKTEYTGDINVTNTSDGAKFDLVVNGDPMDLVDLADGSKVSFKMVHQTEVPKP